MRNFVSRRPSRLELLLAERKGTQDGRRGVTRPVPARGAHGPVMEAAWTPFIGQKCYRADEISDLLVAALMEQPAPLLTKIYRQSTVVERQHDVDHDLTEETRGRFIETLTGWRTAVATARSQAETAVKQASQLILCYWGAYQRAYLDQRPNTDLQGGWQPLMAVLDPQWDKPDPFLLLIFRPEDDAPDRATRHSGRTLGRALEIISDCDCPICQRPAPEYE